MSRASLLFALEAYMHSGELLSASSDDHLLCNCSSKVHFTLFDYFAARLLQIFYNKNKDKQKRSDAFYRGGINMGITSVIKKAFQKSSKDNPPNKKLNSIQDPQILIYTANLSNEYPAIKINMSGNQFSLELMRYLKVLSKEIGADGKQVIKMANSDKTFSFDHSIFAPMEYSEFTQEQITTIYEKLAALRDGDFIFVVGNSELELEEYCTQLIRINKDCQANICCILNPMKSVTESDQDPLKVLNVLQLSEETTNRKKEWKKLLESQQKLSDIQPKKSNIVVFGDNELSGGFVDALANEAAEYYNDKEKVSVQMNNHPLLTFELDPSLASSGKAKSDLPYAQDARNALINKISNLGYADRIVIIADDERSFPFYVDQLRNACVPINIKPSINFVKTAFKSNAEDYVCYPKDAKTVDAPINIVEQNWSNASKVWDDIIISKKLSLDNINKVVFYDKVAIKSALKELDNNEIHDDVNSNSGASSSQHEATTTADPAPPDLAGWHMPSPVHAGKQRGTFFLGRSKSAPNLPETATELVPHPLRYSDPPKHN